MSAPVEKDRNTQDGWMYAPRWAHDGEKDVPFVPSPPVTELAEPENLEQLAAHLAARMPPATVVAPPALRQGDPRPEEFATVPPWMHKKARSLEPVSMPLPPIEAPQRQRIGHARRAMALAGVAAIGAYLFVYGPPDMVMQVLDARFTDSAAEQPVASKSARLATAPRLIANDLRGVAGDWIAVDVAAEGAPTGGDAVISGLPAGTTLSVGQDFGAAGWRIELADLGKLRLHVPPHIAGSSDLTVELRRSDAVVVDRKSIRLDVVSPRFALASVSPVQAVPQSETKEQRATPPVSPQRQPDNVALAALPPRAAAPGASDAAAEPPARKLDPAEIVVMLRRGEELARTGDLAGARLLLQRAADARHAGAAFALAATYDPVVLKQIAVVGQSGDAEKARLWYERARDLGSKEAALRLEALARWGK